MGMNEDNVHTDSGQKIHDEEVQQQWVTKLSGLYGDQASTDCSIEIGGVSIPAHKCILMANSPVFRSMFTHQEAQQFQTGIIKIDDFKEPEPMRAVVRYCYQGFLDTGTMDGGEWMVETFKLADRYCIAGLKALLEKHFVSKTLNVDNVVAMAVLADMHSAEKLREACHKMIAIQGDAVFETAQWMELSDGELIAKVFQLADKYSILELKPQLEKHFIAKRLNVGNVIAMALLAEMHSAPKLIEACIKLIVEEGKAVYESVEWKELKEADSKLAADLAEGAATVLAQKLVKSELDADRAKKDAAESKNVASLAERDAAELTWKLVRSELATDRAKKDAAESKNIANRAQKDAAQLADKLRKLKSPSPYARI